MTRRVVVLAAALVVIAGGLFATLATGDDKYIVSARLKNAAGIREGGEVRLSGVAVGKVTDLRLNSDDSVSMRLAVERAAAPVGVNASAQVRSADLLGDKYVDLVPGDLSRPMPSGGTIPQSRTGTPVNLDDLLSVMRPDTRMRLRILIQESGLALTGRGADLNRLLQQLPSALDESRRLVDGFASDTAALGRLLDESDRLLATVTPQRAALGRFVSSASRAFSAIGERHAELGATVREAPSTLAQLRATLGELDATAIPLRPAARALRRTAPILTAVLREVPRLEPAIMPAFRTVRRVAPSITRLGREASPFVRRLQPTAARLAEFAVPLDGASDVGDKGANDLLGVMEGWARAIQGRDSASHLFRGQAQLNPELLKRLIDEYVSPQAPRARSPKQRSVERAIKTVPHLEAPPVKDRLPRLPIVPNKILKQLDGVVGETTERVQNDTKNLLDFLLK